VRREQPASPYVGHLLKRKNVQAIVESLDVLVHREKVPGASLTIVGAGPERARISRLIRDRGLEAHVTQKPFLAPADLVYEMKRADLLLLLSNSERTASSLQRRSRWVRSVSWRMRLRCTSLPRSSAVLEFSFALFNPPSKAAPLFKGWEYPSRGVRCSLIRAMIRFTDAFEASAWLEKVNACTCETSHYTH
jgi:hypothetical protein